MNRKENGNRRERNLTIAGHTIKRGAAINLDCVFSESYLGRPVSIPLRVIAGERPGPTAFITGAIHGDEITGVGIIRELLYGHSLELKKGTLICVPVVNVYGLEHHSRYLPDRRDLNRCFPGAADGSLSSRLAHTLITEVIEKCDFGIDFHSAAIRRTNFPNVRADMRVPKVKTLARAFGCELIVDSTGPEGSLRRIAVKKGVPTIILEAGEVWKFERGVIDAGVRGCLNVLHHFQMIDQDAHAPLFQTTLKRTEWIRAEAGGFLGLHAKPGELVEAGQRLGVNYSIFGRGRSELIWV